jgi:hypothetical protein
MDCPRCKEQLDALSVLQNGAFSWPELSAFWFVCPYCDDGSHFRAQDHGLSLIRILGPGPEWEVIDALHVSSLTVRTDPSFLHIWLGQAHFEFPARGA